MEISQDVLDMFEICPGYEDCKTEEECHKRTLELSNKIQESFAKLNKDPQWLSSYWKLSFGDNIYGVVEEKNISKEDLSKILNKSGSYVTSGLNGTANLTLEAIA